MQLARSWGNQQFKPLTCRRFGFHAHFIFVGFSPGMMQIGRLLRGRPQALDGEELLLSRKILFFYGFAPFGKILDEVRKRCWNLRF
jgi:hypothetical protein